MLLLLGINQSLHAEYQLLDKITAIVDNEVVLASDIRKQMQQVKSNLASQGNLPPNNQILFEKVLERSILDSLQLQRAYKIGFRISDQELNNAMERIASQNGLTLTELRVLLEKEGASFTALREKTRQDMLIQRTQQRSVMRQISISQSEIDNFLASTSGKEIMQQELSIDHILIPLTSNATETSQETLKKNIASLRAAAKNKQFVDISTDIERLNALHKPLGWRKEEDIPTMFSKTIKTLNIGEVSQPITSDSGIHLIRIIQKRGGVEGSTVETHVSHILLTESEIRNEQQSLELMDKIESELKLGRKFNELAILYSDDPGSALQGGALNWNTPDMLVPEFASAMDATDIGGISKRFKSNFGWHILKVNDRREKDLSKEKAEQQARMAIAKTKYDDELNNWLQELRDDAYVEIK